MAKLSRRKRKELEEKGITRKNLKKERIKTANEEGYVPKRLHICRDYDYQIELNPGCPYDNSYAESFL